MGPQPLPCTPAPRAWPEAPAPHARCRRAPVCPVPYPALQHEQHRRETLEQSQRNTASTAMPAAAPLPGSSISHRREPRDLGHPRQAGAPHSITPNLQVSQFDPSQQRPGTALPSGVWRAGHPEAGADTQSTAQGTGGWPRLGPGPSSVPSHRIAPSATHHLLSDPLSEDRSPSLWTWR